MPLYKRIMGNSGCRAHIWRITEPESDLAEGIDLTPACRSRLEGMKSGIHRRGFLSIRHLLALEGYTDFDLFYDEKGKPHLKDGTHISITHSFEFTGIILSDSVEVGIDIEKQRDKILRIARKFTPIAEYRSLANEEALVRKLTMVWTAKESIYKILSTPGLSFLRHIWVDDFSMDEARTTASVHYQGKENRFSADFLEFEGYTCGYAIQD